MGDFLFNHPILLVARLIADFFIEYAPHIRIIYTYHKRNCYKHGVPMNRRNFLRSCAIAGATGTALSAGFLSDAWAQAAKADSVRNFNPGMSYRPHGLTGANVSALGLGMMRPPRLTDGSVDEDQFIRMARHAIDSGVNYIDTSYVYLNGESEKITGKALANGYRDRVYISSKSPWWLMERPEDFERFFDESRKRLDTDHIDFYQLHMLMHRGWKEKAVPFRLIEKINNLKAQGKISFAGFSFHDGFPLFKKIVAANPDWDFCLVQHNLLDAEHEAGLQGLNHAAANGMGVSIMEPLRGGVLAVPPREVTRIYADYPVKRTPVEWALDYLWNKPEVSVVVSGMSDMEQLNENLKYASRAYPGMLDGRDRALLGKVARQYDSYPGVVPCTGCYNCIPCPQNVAIGYLFRMVNNQYRVTNDLGRAHKLVTASMSPIQRGDRPQACNECGECLAKCPQGINIPAELKRIDRELHLREI